jgi:hypothetical protein
MFDLRILRDLEGSKSVRYSGNGVEGMSFRWVRNFILLIYVAVGFWVAWDHGYLGLAFLRTLASALLAILLWWLVPLGVNLHVH